MQTHLNLTSEKATLVLINTWGFPIARRVKIAKSKVEHQLIDNMGNPYGDHSIEIVYSEKGKRKLHASRFSKSNHSQIAIYDGWHEATTPNEFECFSDDVFEMMKAQIDAQPVFEINVKNSY